MAAALPSEAQPFPWEEAMGFGFGVLRLSSRDFWAMTLPELAAAARGARGMPAGAMPFDRVALDALMALFPDRTSPD